MIILIKNSNQKKSEIFIINLAILLYLFRTAIPLFKIPFFFILAILIIYSLVNYRKDLKTSLTRFINNFTLTILLAVILVLSFLFSDKLYVEIFKDILNITILFLLFFGSSLLIKNKINLEAFYKTLIKLIIFFAFLISINFLFDLLEIKLTGNNINNMRLASIQESPEIDSNFGLLPIIFGIISVFYLRIKTNSKYLKMLYSLLLIIFAVSIFIMGSRRGLIFLIAFSSILFFFLLLPFFKSTGLIKNLMINALHFFISLILFSMILFFLTFSTSYIFKNKALEFIGSKNITEAKTKITKVISRYIYVFDDNFSYENLYSKIFFTPKDPDSGWGTRIHKTIYPLTGINSENIPPETKGYFMDNTCNSDSRSGNAYSYTAISSKYVKKDIILKASVFCYLSIDFDGTWAMLTSEGATDGKKESEYNLGKKVHGRSLNYMLKAQVEFQIFTYTSQNLELLTSQH